MLNTIVMYTAPLLRDGGSELPPVAVGPFKDDEAARRWLQTFPNTLFGTVEQFTRADSDGRIDLVDFMPVNGFVHFEQLAEALERMASRVDEDTKMLLATAALALRIEAAKEKEGR